MRRFLIIGLDTFGRCVACELREAGFDVTVVDHKPSGIQDVVDKLDTVSRTDFICPETLHRIGVNEFDVVILGFTGNFDLSTVIIPLLKRLGVRFLVATASTEEEAVTLKRLGADWVIVPEREAGYYLAEYLIDGVHWRLTSVR